MITPRDAAIILAKMSAFDQRTVGEADVVAWTEALNVASPPIARDDALAAVTQWHAENVDGRMRPAHVVQGAQAVAHRRAGAERRALLDRQMAIEACETTDKTAELRAACERLAAGMGMGDPDALRPREAAWKRKQQRQPVRAEHSESVTNPLFRGYPPEGGVPFPGDPAMA